MGAMVIHVSFGRRSSRIKVGDIDLVTVLIRSQ